MNRREELILKWNIVIKIVSVILDLEVRNFLTEHKLTKSKTNHNIGARVTYLNCSVSGCPKKLRVVTNLIPTEGVSPYVIEEITDTIHNHQVDLPRNRGLSLEQKAIIKLCVERGQGAPKKVRAAQFSNFCRQEKEVWKLKKFNLITSRLFENLHDYAS